MANIKHFRIMSNKLSRFGITWQQFKQYPHLLFLLDKDFQMWWIRTFRYDQSITWYNNNNFADFVSHTDVQELIEEYSISDPAFSAELNTWLNSNHFLDPETAHEFESDFHEPGPSSASSPPVASSPERSNSSPDRVQNIPATNSRAQSPDTNSDSVLASVPKGSGKHSGKKDNVHRQQTPKNKEKPKSVANTPKKKGSSKNTKGKGKDVSKNLFNRTPSQKPTVPTKDHPGTTTSATNIGQSESTPQQITPEGPRHNTKGTVQGEAGNRKIQKSSRIYNIQVWRDVILKVLLCSLTKINLLKILLI